MKPVKLILNAFGPFARQQELDFEHLEGARIFLITGETGAGKTTIFDAIAYALYGSASGENRKPNTFKSHHAGPEEPCWVTLTFRLRGEDYTVTRSPAQTGRKRDGSPKELTEKAELLLPGGETLTRTTAVTRKIEELLGLNYRQFKQTILLAQGEFRRLLEANSTQKQEIFSKIFSTDQYSDFAERLAAREKALGERVREVQQDIGREIAELIRLGHPLPGEEAQFLPLEDVQKLVEGRLALHREKMEQIDTDMAVLEEARQGLDLEGARELNQRLEGLEVLKKDLADLEARRGEMAEHRALLARLKAAVEMAEQEKIILSTRDAMEALSNKLDELVRLEKESGIALEEARRDYDALPGLRARREAIAGELAELAAKEQARQEAAGRQQQLDEKRRQEAEVVQGLTALEAALCHAGSAEKLAGLRAARQSLERLKQLLEQQQGLEQEHRQAVEDYKQAYDDFLKGQAAMLAEGLGDDLPCPVCGSRHHPAPAKPVRGGVTSAALRDLAQQRDNLLEKIKDRGNTAEVLMDDLSDFLPSGERHLAKVEAALAELLPRLEKERQATEALRAAVDPHLLTRDGPWLEAERGRVTGLLSAAREGIAVLAPLVEANRKEPDWAARQKVLREQAAKLEASITSGEQAYLTARSRQDKLTAELEAGRRHHAALQDQFAGLRADFVTRLEQSGFSGYKDYRRVADRGSELADLTRRVEEYDSSLASRKAQVETLEGDLQGKTRVDLDALSKKLGEIHERLRGLNQTKLELHTLLTSSRQRMDSLERLHHQSGDLGGQYLIARDLATLAKGGRPPYISFERYVLAAYFDDILEVANIHFQRMTNLRYRFKRREDAGGRTAGLDMDIIDSYTGTSRGVSTLSGGEGFKASLALALGLSDVVQMYAGGISIDTMLIDEGFGSLDEKSLDSVVETLLSLEQTGRTVGIISHVPTLRSYIPAKLVVRREGAGSRACFRLG